jgi:hypothetical protein
MLFVVSCIAAALSLCPAIRLLLKRINPALKP